MQNLEWLKGYKKKKKVKKVKILPIEKFLITIIVILAVIVPIGTVFSKATLSKSNIDVESIKYKVDVQTNRNQSLSMQVDELASLSNIQDVAKNYGLSYNNDNIIVINN